MKTWYSTNEVEEAKEEGHYTQYSKDSEPMPISEMLRTAGPHNRVIDYWQLNLGIYAVGCLDCNCIWPEGGFYPLTCNRKEVEKGYSTSLKVGS